MTLRTPIILFVGAALAMACGSPPTPRQLTDARAAYRKAQSGHASRLAPAELHTAKVALNEAEASFKEEPESEGTVTKAYVALRLAQQVESEANAKAAQKDLEAAQKEYHELQGKEMQRTRAELAAAKQALNARDKELAVRGEQLAAADTQLAQSAEQIEAERKALEAERKARAAAEEREREAMRKLAAAAAINVKEEARGTVIVLPGNVMFDSGKWELTPGAQKKLILVSGTLAPQSETNNITVEGHTDSRGKRETNMSLSQQRADAVANFMIAHGVLKESVKAIGKGPDVPVATNDTREGRQQNRRVEIIIKPMEAR